MLKRFEQTNGDDVVIAMREIAQRTLPDGVTGEEDFEILVGAFGAESRTLGILGTLAQLTEPENQKLLQSITQVSEFAKQVQDTGISHVLQVIAERTHAQLDKSEFLEDIVEAIKNTFPGEITFGNLNYGTLLLAALVRKCERDFADMGHGYKDKIRVTVDNDETRLVPPLRKDPSDFPTDRRIRLLNLHGSLTYWANHEKDIYVKLPKGLVHKGTQLSIRRLGGHLLCSPINAKNRTILKSSPLG